jgi:hypothetical protein
LALVVGHDRRLAVILGHGRATVGRAVRSRSRGRASHRYRSR